MKSKPQYPHSNEVTLVYEGPETYRVMVWTPPGRESQTFTMVQDEPQSVPRELADELLAQNPRGCSLEDARDYGAQLFSVHNPKNDGGD